MCSKRKCTEEMQRATLTVEQHVTLFSLIHVNKEIIKITRLQLRHGVLDLDSIWQ